MFAYFNRPSLTLKMTLKQAQSASHAGQCDSDVLALSKVPAIARQLRKLDPVELAAELAEYTDWDVSDHSQNLQRILWIAAGNIVEESKAKRPRHNNRKDAQ